jgi:hypothetical protein
MALGTPAGKGFDLEEALKAYFWQAGYFVVRGVPFRLDGEDVTDIDIWIYERPAALTRRRLIVDAKNRRSPKVSERIIWTSGLRAALGVDGAIVATTDQRPSARNLAKALNVVLLGGDAVTKLMHSEQLNKGDQLRSEELDQAVKRVDESRRSSEWRQKLRDARGALISGMGAQSANLNLSTSGYFAEQTVAAQPRSEPAQVALRLFYLTSALAAISLDFALADQAFRSHEERRHSIIRSIRFGEAEGVARLPIVRAAIGLARKYADNGAAVAKQIEYGFNGDAERVPAEIIADHVARISGSDALFNISRELERASSSIELPGFDDLSSEAKSLLGVFLDFNEISREKVAEAWPRKARGPVEESAATSETKAGPLFAGEKGRVNSEAPTGKDPPES